MSRRKVSPVRPVLPDPRFGSKILAKFVSRMMVDGKKSVARRAVYDAMDVIDQKMDEEPLQVF